MMFVEYYHLEKQNILCRYSGFDITDAQETAVFIKQYHPDTVIVHIQ